MQPFQIKANDLIKGDGYWIVPEKSYGLEVMLKGQEKPDQEKISWCNSALEKIVSITEKAVIALDAKKDFPNLEEWELISIEFPEAGPIGNFNVYFANEAADCINVLWEVKCVNNSPRITSYRYW